MGRLTDALEAANRSHRSTAAAASGGGLGLYLEGSKISGVAKGTPCHRAGMLEGDEIKRVNGAPVNPQTCRPMLGDCVADGEVVSITVARKNQLVEISVRLSSKDVAHSGQIVNRYSGREVML